MGHPSVRHPQMSQALALLLFIASLLVMNPTSFAAEVYKTVDEKGRVTYTDTPPPGQKVEKVDLPQVNSLPRTSAQPRDTPPPMADTIPRSYQVFITAPEPESHVNPGQQDLNIQVATDPSLHRRHRLVILDNGSPVSGDGASATVTNIIRGSHSIQAQVLDESGRVLGQSQPVTVYVHRPSLNSPARQPAKPPVKPKS